MTDWIIAHPYFIFFTCSALAFVLACVYLAMRFPIAFFKYWLPILGWGGWFVTWIPLLHYPSTPAAQAPVLPVFFIAILTTFISRDYARKLEEPQMQGVAADHATAKQIADMKREILDKLEFHSHNIQAEITALRKYVAEHPVTPPPVWESSAKFVDPSHNSPAPAAAPHKGKPSGLYVGDANE